MRTKSKIKLKSELNYFQLRFKTINYIKLRIFKSRELKVLNLRVMHHGYVTVAGASIGAGGDHMLNTRFNEASKHVSL